MQDDLIRGNLIQDDLVRYHTHCNENNCSRNLSTFFQISVPVIGVRKMTINFCHNIVASHSPHSKIGSTHLHMGWFTFPSQFLNEAEWCCTNSYVDSKLHDFHQSHVGKIVFNISVTVFRLLTNVHKPTGRPTSPVTFP